MKQHLRMLLILVAILSIGSIVYFVMNFLKKKKDQNILKIQMKHFKEMKKTSIYSKIYQRRS